MSAQEAHSAIDHRPVSGTARRVTLVLLALPPLIALMLLAYATLWHQPRLVHTGDALLDVYLQALVDHGVVSSVESFSLFGKKDALPPALWRQWEQQYGKDPRFWMLCYYARPYDPAYSKAPPAKYESDVNYLRTARARGAVDWIVLLTLLRDETSDWIETARKKLALANPGNYATQQERERYDARIWEEVTRVHGAELKSLQDELRRAGADQAQAHYYLAQIASERGDMPGGLSELVAGNAAPHNDSGLGLPFDALTAAARQGQMLAGDNAITGQMALGSHSIMFSSFIRYREMVRATAAWAVKRRDISALQVLHRCCCRYAVSDGAGSLQAQVAAGTEMTVTDAVQQFTYGDATVHRQALSQAQAQRRAINSALLALDASCGSFTWPSAWDTAFVSAPAVSSGGRYSTLDMLRGYSSDLITEQTALAGPIRQQFEALASIDFTK
jgi:hypothetical protein